jgi:hypothetical protein
MLSIANWTRATEVLESNCCGKSTIVEAERTDKGPEIKVVDFQTSITLVMDYVIDQRDMAFRVLNEILLMAIDPRETT